MLVELLLQPAEQKREEKLLQRENEESGVEEDDGLEDGLSEQEGADGESEAERERMVLLVTLVLVEEKM